MRCNNCGYEADSKFCPNCGTKLEKEMEQQVEQKTIAVDENETRFTNEANLNISGEIDNLERFSKQWFKYWSPAFAVIGVILFSVLIVVNWQSCENSKVNNSMSDTSYDDYEDSDSYYDDYEYEDETEKPITYKSVSTKKLFNNCDYYDYEYITTTIKVTKADNDNGKYKYTVYEVDGYDEVSIIFNLDLDTKKIINIGDYLTVNGECEVYDDYDTLKIIVDADKKVKTDKSLFIKFGGTETKPIIYSEDYYKVGVDIPAGTYIAYPTSNYGGYYGIYSDANGDDIVANNNFDGQNYFTVSSGQYLDLTRCEARPVSQRLKVEYENGYLTEGQYLVGVDVPAGEYKLTSTSDYGAYYALTSDGNSDNIISNDNFDNSRYVYISNGQYLELVRCKMKVT